MRRASTLAVLAVLVAACGGPSAPPPPATCASDRECSAPASLCDRTRRSCVACLDDTGCDATSYCAAGTCAARTLCTTSRTCAGLVCDTAAGYCAECSADADCAAPLRCHDHGCVDVPPPCVSDAACSASGYVCDTSSGLCVECVRDSDCTVGVCGVDRRCAERDGGEPDASDAGPDDGGTDMPIGPPYGALHVTWSVTASGAPATCAEIGATQLFVTVSPLSVGTPLYATPACTDVSMDFPHLVYQEWRVTVEARGASGVAVGASPGTTTAVLPTGCTRLVGGDCVHDVAATIRSF